MPGRNVALQRWKSPSFRAGKTLNSLLVLTRDVLQAGNQLIALQTRQLLDLTALIAAQSRARSLDGARLAANQEQGRTQLNQFLTAGRGYQAQTVQMFHQ